MRRTDWILVAAAGVLAIAASPADHDPNLTATILVPSFEDGGADRHGVYGDDVSVPLLAQVAALVGLPVTDGSASLPPNVAAATTYYGDTPPAYYTAADVAEIAQVTSQWGGGVPRYAAIVAKYARQVMARSGARQVNFVSTSFGSLVTRWLIEKDVGGLAGAGAIARWLSVEGVLCGNWAASRDELVHYLDVLDPQPIDVHHMAYGWVEANLHSPRGEADDPHYAGILLGAIGSTDDRYDNGALSALMASYGEYQTNDGVQALADAVFRTVTPRSRLAGLPPTLSLFHATHPGLADRPAARAQAALFFTQRRRVTVTLTTAQVTDLHEPQQWYWDWRPAEVVFESRAYSPAAQSRWGIGDPMFECRKEGTAAPLRHYASNGETRSVDQVLFDGFVPADETQLRLELQAEEIDYDAGYGVYETTTTPDYDDLGSGTLFVSVVTPGGYDFRSSSWNGRVEVAIVDYPFALPATASVLPAGAEDGLSVSPNPSVGAVRVMLHGNTAAPGPATLSVYDVGGRRVRRQAGDASAGFVWDGRDDLGHALPAGLYLVHVQTSRGVHHGRSCLVR